MYDDLLQEWTLQPTDGQPVTLAFNSFDFTGEYKNLINS